MENIAENETTSSSSLKKNLKRISWLKNKYLLAGTFFLVWMLFFDPKDIGNVISKKSKYHELQVSEEHLADKITETKQELNQLKTSAQTIEKYAREKYLMKKDNEDLFLVTDEKTAN
ncbi:MAG: septum formation initiator family protein [Ferruginibacter sp.]